MIHRHHRGADRSPRPLAIGYAAVRDSAGTLRLTPTARRRRAARSPESGQRLPPFEVEIGVYAGSGGRLDDKFSPPFS